MKRFFYLLPAIALVFAACSDSDDDGDEDGNGNGNGNGNGGTEQTIVVKASEISNYPDNDDVDEVGLWVYHWSESTGAQAIVLAKSPWDKGFEIELPETVASTYLEPVYQMFGLDTSDFIDYYEDGTIAVSDKNAKLCYAYFAGYKNNTIVGDFELDNDEDDSSKGEHWVEYMYSDRDLKITAEFTDDNDDNIVFDIDFKKGWNICYGVYEWKESNSNFGYYSSIPTNSDVKWNYRPRYNAN